MPTPADHIATYVRAKDHNRPHLMSSAFAGDAELTMDVKTDAISFPSRTSGCEAISRVLVQDFGRTYENVYTFCLAQRPSGLTERYSCDWLVGMSVKADGAVRLGCGRYDWHFQHAAPHLVAELRITIDAMDVSPSVLLAPVMNWLSGKPYPWCSPSTMLEGMPEHAELEAVRRRLREG